MLSIVPVRALLYYSVGRVGRHIIRTRKAHTRRRTHRGHTKQQAHVLMAALTPLRRGALCHVVRTARCAWSRTPRQKTLMDTDAGGEALWRAAPRHTRKHRRRRKRESSHVQYVRRQSWQGQSESSEGCCTALDCVVLFHYLHGSLLRSFSFCFVFCLCFCCVRAVSPRINVPQRCMGCLSIFRSLS